MSADRKEEEVARAEVEDDPVDVMGPHLMGPVFEALIQRTRQGEALEVARVRGYWAMISYLLRG